MGFFEQIFGTELGLPARAVVALVLVLALIALTVWLMRRFGEGRIATGGSGRGRQQRLAVLDSAVVDARRRLVLIRRDNVEHLILIGGPSDVVVEPNIVRAQPLPGTARPGARPGGFELEEGEAPFIPEPEPEPARPAAPPAREPQRPIPRPAPQRVDPQYADMAQRLEAALRKPVSDVEPPRPAPAPTPRAPEPRLEPRPAPAPRPAPSVIQAAPRAPEPRIVEAPRPAPASAPAVQPAPAAKQEVAADIFGSLEEEMASLLRPGKKENK